jgi:ElaB/YqjD/DUF883 family membrane-anchored ribosome-binding protein
MSTERIDPEAIDLDYVKQEFNRFRSEFFGAREKLSGNASDALDQISAYLNGGNGLSSRLASLESELGHLTDRLKGGGKEAVIRIEKEVEQHPITSIAVAFGVGLLAAQLFHRS